MKHKIESVRLTLRPLELSDASFVLELFNSENWLKYIGDRGIRTLADAEVFLQNNALRFFDQKGWGTYLINLSEQDLPIGTVGLYQRENLTAPDFGYALLPQFEGKGLATEAGRAYLEGIAVHTKIEKIFAIVQDDNPRSHRVLKKLGFQRDGHIMMEKELQKWVKYQGLKT